MNDELTHCGRPAHWEDHNCSATECCVAYCSKCQILLAPCDQEDVPTTIGDTK